MRKDEISTKTGTWRKRSKKKIEVEEKKEKKKLFRHENRNTVEPRSNGIVFITDSYSWSLQINFY